MKSFLQMLIVNMALSGQALLFAEPESTGAEVSQPVPDNPDVTVLDPNGRKYFPDDFDNWYRKHLFAMREPSLFSGDPAGDDQMRFLCLPTFSKPICFRGFKREGRFFVRVARLTGQGGYEPGGLEIDANIEITKEEWDALTQAVTESANEFKLTSDQQAILAGLDGTSWILESRIGGKYHFQDVWEPDYWTSKEGFKSLERLNEGMADKSKLDALKIALFRDACTQFLLLTDFAVPSRMVPEDLQSEQAGAGQPATRSESKPEGGDKPQPESEGHSR